MILNNEYAHFVNFINKLIFLMNASSPEFYNNLYMKMQYEDAKIEIIGTFIAPRINFSRISVNIKTDIGTKPLSTSVRRAMGFVADDSKPSESYTLVFEARFNADKDKYEEVWRRPGVWLKYIDKLVEEQNEIIRNFEKDNNIPVQDKEFFSDVL